MNFDKTFPSSWSLRNSENRTNNISPSSQGEYQHSFDDLDGGRNQRNHFDAFHNGNGVNGRGKQGGIDKFQMDTLLNQKERNTSSFLDGQGIKTLDEEFSNVILLPIDSELSSEMGHENCLIDRLKQYADICNGRIQLLQKQSFKANITQDMEYKILQEIEILKQERNTWLLIYSILQSSKLTSNSAEKGNQTFSLATEDLWKVSHRDVVEKLIQNDETLKREIAIVEWLELISRLPLSQKNTHETSTEDILKKENIADALDKTKDVDYDIFIKKEQGQSKDSKTEEEFLGLLWKLIRSGKLEEAQDLCRKCRHYWRAATLAGAIPFRTNQNEKNQLSKKQSEMSHSNCSNRFVYMNTLFQLSKDQNFQSLEKALYGSLCGNLTAMKVGCENWEDYLWAHLKSIIDYSINKELQKWLYHHSHDKAFVDILLSQQVEQVKQFITFDQQSNQLLNVMQYLQNSDNPIVRKESIEPYHLIQTDIILDRLAELILRLEQWITSHQRQKVFESPQSTLFGVGISGEYLFLSNLLRFATHYVLFLKQMFSSPNEIKIPEQADMLIYKYIHCLISSKQYNLVALYTSKLDIKIQVPVYSKFLEQIDDMKQSKLCIELGKKYNLDVKSSTKLLVQNIRAASEKSSSSTDKKLTPTQQAILDQSRTSPIPIRGPLQFSSPKSACSDTSTMSQQKMSNLDEKKLNSILWLCFDPSQRSEAIIQGNALIRDFIREDNLQAVRKILFELLPGDSIKLVKAQAMDDEILNAIHEHESWKLYISAIDKYMQWKMHSSEKPLKPQPPISPSTSSDELSYDIALKKYHYEFRQWAEKEDKIAQESITRLMQILESEDRWLTDIETPEVNNILKQYEQREEELHKLRQICVPNVVFLLYNILFSQEKIEECLALSDILADDHHMLYHCFSQEELQKFLLLMKECTAIHLDNLFEKEIEMAMSNED